MFWGLPADTYVFVNSPNDGTDIPKKYLPFPSWKVRYWSRENDNEYILSPVEALGGIWGIVAKSLHARILLEKGT